MSKGQYVEFPEKLSRRELNARYREIPLKASTSCLLRKYFDAMATLYAIIPLYKAKEIILTLSPGLVTEDEFLAFAEIACHECTRYYILDNNALFSNIRHTKPLEREIIDAALLEGSLDLYIAAKHSQQDKPYYVPSKEQLLEYTDFFYCEDTLEKLKLRDFLRKRCNLSEEQGESVLEALLINARSPVSEVADAFDCLEMLGVQFKSQQDLERFTALYSAFHNTTRMPCNRGYTPKELMQMSPPGARLQSISLGPNIRALPQTGKMDIEDFRKQILAMDLPSEAVRLDLLRQLAAIKPPAVQAVKQGKKRT